MEIKVAASLTHADDIARLDLRTRHIDFLDHSWSNAVTHQLPGLLSARPQTLVGRPHCPTGIPATARALAGNARLPFRTLKHATELALHANRRFCAASVFLAAAGCSQSSSGAFAHAVQEDNSVAQWRIFPSYTECLSKTTSHPLADTTDRRDRDTLPLLYLRLPDITMSVRPTILVDSNSLDIRHYTRRRFGGRQPLCGIGVTSRIILIRNPAA